MGNSINQLIRYLNSIGFKGWIWLQRRWRLICLTLSISIVIVGVFLSISLVINTLKLSSAASAPVDVFFVLGGSIRREVYAAELAKHDPKTRILISQGSKDPCILLIFQKYQAPPNQVWLEKCANSTFGNFFFNIPILKKWRVHHVKLITSPTHLPRAKWLAQILLGAQGMWVDVDTVHERGIPGNQESQIKTGLDIGRSLIWALLSQAIQPPCSHVTRLTEVDLKSWDKSGFECETQSWLKLKKSPK